MAERKFGHLYSLTVPSPRHSQAQCSSRFSLHMGAVTVPNLPPSNLKVYDVSQITRYTIMFSQNKLRFLLVPVCFLFETFVVVARSLHPFTATVRKAKALPMLRPLETKVTIPTIDDVFVILWGEVQPNVFKIEQAT